MKESYILEYQNNFAQNLAEKQSNISQFMETIAEKKDGLTNLKNLKSQNKSLMKRFLDMHLKLHQMRFVFNILKTYTKYKREKKRKWAYERNTLYRKKMTRFFKSLHTVCHNDGKRNIMEYEKTFR